MAITYTMRPRSLVVSPEVDGFPNVVTRVNWEYEATDGTFTVSNPHGWTVLHPPAPEGPFTPFASLTESQVAAWILASWTPEQLEANQRPLAEALARSRTGSSVVPPPWETQTAGSKWNPLNWFR